MKNIQDALEVHAIPFSSIRNPPGRIVVLTQEEKALTILKNVFGISSLSFATEIDRSMKKIEREVLLSYRMRAQPGKTFRISTQRLDKRFYLTSQEVNAIIGAFIVEQENAQVNLDNPDIDIGIEIMHNAAYIFVGRTPGYGGLPVGVQGKVLVDLKDRRSAVAAWMMLKRGCELVVCGDETILPYLEPFSYGHSITYVPHPEKAKDYLAVVFSELEFGKRKIPSFYPLLALTEQQIRDIETLIF
ncbi:MAG: hypothetical protein HXS44_10550 [Theionarchaea archaeon]|nr:hypothetical protein [Theionarchaea archaeon]